NRRDRGRPRLRRQQFRDNLPHGRRREGRSGAGDDQRGEMTEGVSYTAQISAHYADVRRRLYGRAPVARVVSIPKVPKALPPVVVAQEPVTDAPAEPFVPSPPINMLTPCSWRFLVALAARAGGVSPEEILGPSRRRPVAAARQVAIALVFQHTQNRDRKRVG